MPDTAFLAVPKGNRQPPPHLPQEVRDLISDNFDSAYDIFNSFLAFQGAWSDGTTSFKEPDWVEFMERPNIKRNVRGNIQLCEQLASLHGLEIHDAITNLAPSPQSKLVGKFNVPHSSTYSMIGSQMPYLPITRREFAEAVRDDTARTINNLLFRSSTAMSKRRAFGLLITKVATEPTFAPNTCQSFLAHTRVPAADRDVAAWSRLCAAHMRSHCRTTMINVVEVSRVELDFADGALVPRALYSWLPTLEVCLRWNSSTDRFISPSQADIIAQMLSGDVDTTWRELCTAHAQGRFDHSERMDAVHRYIVCMRAARMTVDYLDQQNGPIAFSHEAPWNFKVLGGILPYGLASVVKADLGEYCPSKMSIDKLFWIMRDLLYQAGDGDRVLATDQASAATTDSS
ncbi:hypothetical protein Slin14017_G130140 [Septoria linicola]|nr:hypothetical protein Slin14017_G130140 [Septoria linicola]